MCANTHTRTVAEKSFSENEQILAALRFPFKTEQPLQDLTTVLVTFAVLVPVALRVQFDLRQNADQELVHVVIQIQRGLDELALAAVRQTTAN